MHRRSALSLVTLAALLMGATSLAKGNEEVVKPLKAVVGSVRYGKDKLALKNFAGEEQGKLLLGDDWAKGTAEQRKEFVDLFQTLFAKIAFPKIRSNFEHLATVLYEDPVLDGAKATVGSTVVIDHPLKKQELKLKYQLIRDGAAWKVVDVSVLGDSMLKGIRDDQIQPIMKEGGWPHLLDLMRKKAKELEGVPLK